MNLVLTMAPSARRLSQLQGMLLPAGGAPEPPRTIGAAADCGASSRTCLLYDSSAGALKVCS